LNIWHSKQREECLAIFKNTLTAKKWNMTQKHNLIIGLIAILSILFIGGCTYRSEISNTPLISDAQVISDTLVADCEELNNNLNVKMDLIGVSKCMEWASEGKSIWVGGKLINISRVNNPAYDRNEFGLTFQGPQKREGISIGVKVGQSLPYEVGKFYRFNLRNTCALLQSMASSGMFYDPNLNNLEHLSECD